ncbi:MAG TPA: hypothetical protein VF444_00405 [Pseudonocardiaceae bacterium]
MAPDPDDTAPAVILVRFRRGVVGERDRVVHVVPLRRGAVLPAVLVARCGVRFRPGEAEWLRRLSGMPCERCLAA